MRVFLYLKFINAMIDESDKSLFRSTVDLQKPLDKDSNKKLSLHKMNASKPFEDYSFLYEANISGSEAITHFKDGLSPKVLKKMKQGNIGSTPSIDLHGYKIDQACKSISDFIHFHSDNGLSIMKSQVVHYLKQHPNVLAFCSCPQEMGGTGAVFVHLKADV